MPGAFESTIKVWVGEPNTNHEPFIITRLHAAVVSFNAQPPQLHRLDSWSELELTATAISCLILAFAAMRKRNLGHRPLSYDGGGRRNSIHVLRTAGSLQYSKSSSSCNHQSMAALVETSYTAMVSGT